MYQMTRFITAHMYSLPKHVFPGILLPKNFQEFENTQELTEMDALEKNHLKKSKILFRIK